MWVWEKKIELKATIETFVVEIKWPKVANKASSCYKKFMITSKSPSTIMEFRPMSKAKEMALATANASTSSEDWGKQTFSAIDAITCS